MSMNNIYLGEIDYFRLYKEKSKFLYNAFVDSEKEMKKSHAELMKNSADRDFVYSGELNFLIRKYKKSRVSLELNAAKDELRSMFYRMAFDDYRKMETSFFHFVSCCKANNEIKDEIKYLDKGLSYAIYHDISSVTCPSIDMEKAISAKQRLDDFCLFFDENKFSCYKLINKEIFIYKNGNKYISEGLSLINAHDAALDNLKVLNSLRKDLML